MLDAGAAAERLGVKRETLYAYVSRGLVTSRRSADGRSSLFDLAEIERLASRSRRERGSAHRLLTLSTATTEVTDEGPRYRGRLATELAGSGSFEEVAALLWGVPPGSWEPWSLPSLPVASDRDRIRLAVILAGASDPSRGDRRPEMVGRAGSRLIASVAAALPARDTERPGVGATGIAAVLSRRLGAPTYSPLFERAIESCLILLADHELAVSTLAVRVAASTRASLYDACLAGLACNGPLHVGASEPAYGLLVESAARGAAAAVDDALGSGSVLPGFGHFIYTERDPRFEALVAPISALSADWGEQLADLVGVARANGLPAPNVDLAIAALSLAAGARRDAGVTIFTVARLAGWVAHYLEELGEQPLRFRARSLFAPLRDS